MTLRSLPGAWLLGALALCLPLTAGCFFVGSDEPADAATSGSYQPTPNPTDADTKEYKALSAQLDERRTEFLGKIADEQRAFGRRLFWLQFEAFAPSFHGYDSPNGARTDYTFSIGGDTYNFEASEQVIATALPNGDKVVYSAYAADAPSTLLDEISVPAPTDEQRWWAYAVDGADVYFVTTGEATTLHRWTPGSEPVALFTLEETGAEVGIFLAFGIENGRMMFTESGRAWVLDMAAKKSTFLGHETEVSGPVSFDDAGAFVPTATAPLYYEFATGTLMDVAGRIDASDFAINATYDTAHRYETDGFLYQGSIYYIGASGVFSLDMSGRVTPILLEPISDEVRIEYRYPAITSDGTLYVTGLTSESGSVGADGPVYAVAGAAPAH